MLNEQEVAFYHEYGYTKAEGVLSGEEVAQLRQVTDEFVEKSRLVSEHDEVYDLEPGHSAAEPKLRRLKSPVQQHPVYEQIMRHPGILDIVAQLIGPAIRTNGNKLKMKSPEFGSAVEWHQDWAFYPHTNDDLLAVGVALDDMLEVNGCLQVLPGSHKGRVYDHHFEGHFAGAVTDPDFDDSGAASIELHAGGISIHHVRALHGSLPNHSERPRRLFLIQYCAGDAWPIHPGNDWDGYSQSFLRGEPSNQPRCTQVPVRLPLPAAKRNGSIYEVQTVLGGSNFSQERD